MCFHKDHVLNLFTSFDIQFHKINRYKDILPFLHNRVILKENPILPMPSNNGDNSSDEDESQSEKKRKCAQMIDNLIDIHGSDPRLQTYFNASYINSMIKQNQMQGSSYIASSSPGLKTSTSRLSQDDAEAPETTNQAENDSTEQQFQANSIITTENPLRAPSQSQGPCHSTPPVSNSTSAACLAWPGDLLQRGVSLRWRRSP